MIFYFALIHTYIYVGTFAPQTNKNEKTGRNEIRFVVNKSGYLIYHHYMS